MTQLPRAPVVVVGAGLGGLVTALELAPAPVIVLTRAPLGREVASAWAQGGIAAAIGPDDDPAEHARDTHAAGDGICDPAIVDLVTREAPACVERLIRLGVEFDRDDSGALALGREGGHHRRRIVHARDATGDVVTRTLIEVARCTPSITILEGAEAEELVTDGGRVVGLLARRGGERLMFAARAVVLATGGAGGLYAKTSNPLGARGDGFVLAARVGARLADLEFVQFHPTAIDVGVDPMPLATEALRGEGAVLVNSNGERFMQGLHPLAELAPRDVVARAIFRQRAAGQRVFLDARAALGARFATRFPTVAAACLAAGIDVSRQPIPVAPAAHYHMGGIAVDADGRTSVPGLWAVGEVAATGLHGANRLASNSLLEAAVFGLRAARAVSGIDVALPRLKVPQRTVSADPGPADWRSVQRVRAVMDSGVGVERDGASLRSAIAELDALRMGSAGRSRIVQAAATAGLLIATAALGRTESRGGHFRRDFPGHDPAQAQRSFYTADALSAQAVAIRASESVRLEAAVAG